MKVIASSVRKGNVLEIDDKLYVVLSAESFFPGKGTPTTQIDMRRISDGVKTTERYRTTEQVERATVEEREHQFLYQDGDGFHFMNMENYDQVTVQPDVVGDQAAYLQPEMKVKLSMHEGQRDRDRAAAEGRCWKSPRPSRPPRGRPPRRRYKPAMLSNGVRTAVPPFITAGTRIVVMTADGSYVERAKE